MFAAYEDQKSRWISVENHDCVISNFWTSRGLFLGKWANKKDSLKHFFQVSEKKVIFVLFLSPFPAWFSGNQIKLITGCSQCIRGSLFEKSNLYVCLFLKRFAETTFAFSREISKKNSQGKHYRFHADKNVFVLVESFQISLSNQYCPKFSVSFFDYH